jgi:hypothetical protein
LHRQQGSRETAGNLDLKEPNINFNFSISFQVFYIASLFHSTESFLKSSQGKGFKKEKHNLLAHIFLPAKKSNRD